MNITPEKAIEILQLNLKEAGLKMPPDTRTALTLAVQTLQMLHNERTIYAYRRVEMLPAEQRSDLN